MTLTGCLFGKGTTRRPQYHVLNSYHSIEPTVKPIALLSDKTLGVGPINLPEYSDRPQIVTRSSDKDGKLQINEFDRWGEPLKYNFIRVLTDNLAELLAPNHIFMFPWQSSVNIDYQVRSVITRFDGTPGEKAVMRARWMIYRDSGKTIISTNQKTYTETVSGETIADLVMTQSIILGQFSRDVASTIKGLEK
jgi:uncharacterized lipoprotein YmbA